MQRKFVSNARSLRLLRHLVREALSTPGTRWSMRLTAPGNLRFGDYTFQRGNATTGHTGGNVLKDEQDDKDAEAQARQGLQAATCLIMSDDGKVLAVSRKHDPSDFGLPGGKVDPGESPEEAAARELQEETGLTAVKLTPVFVRHDADGFTTTTFACEAEGTISTPEEGVVRWVTPDVLFQGSFGEYNRRLFRKLGKLK